MQAGDKQSSSAGIVLGLSPGKQDRYTCICCRVKFVSVDLQRSHFKTEWHLYNLKRKVCLLEPIDIESFNQIQLNTVKDVDNESESGFSFVHLDQKDEVDTSSGTLDDEEWERLDDYDLDEDELVDKDYNEDEIDELLANMISADTCLFCDKRSTNIKSNINHMSDLHGFFIPEEKYLIDLDGLMEYIGFKVGSGSTCLWCNKQFSSLQGVRLHMKNKDHCRILYDQESAIKEFKEYYDYSTQKQIDMKPYSELVLASTKSRQRRRPELDDRHKALVVMPRKRTLAAPIESDRDSVAKLDRAKRAVNKFNSNRAKNLLQVGLINNQTMRSRFKHQNPI